MPNRRIDQLNPNLNPLTGLELIPIFDINNNTTERITLNNLANFVDISTDTFVNGATFNNTTDTLTLSRNNNSPIDVVINRYSRWYVPSGQTLTIPNGFQSFVYGDFILEGTINLQENGQLVVLNGDIILSGGTIIGSGTTYSIDLPEFNTFVTNGVLNPSTKQINFTGNFGFTPFSVDLSGITTPYKVYTALLTQSGTNAPVATVLENTIGEIVWGYDNVGHYTATLNSAFTLNKTVVLVGTVSPIANALIVNDFNNVSQVWINTTLLTTAPPTDSNGLLGNTPIEIRVYN